MKNIFPFAIMIAIAALALGTANAQDQITLGPSGGYGGSPFVDSVPSGAVPSEILIRSGTYVDTLQMVLQLPNGQIEYMDRHGGNGGDADSFDLRDGEYITAIGGRYGQYVDSIQFYTNMRISTIYGGSGGDADYYYEAPPGWQIVGFYGRSGDYVDAIGVVLAKL
jgi:hypothetical protein